MSSRSRSVHAGLPWRRIARVGEGLEVTASHGSGYLAGSTSPSSRARVMIIAVLSHYPRQIVRQKLMGADSSICVGPEQTLGYKKRIQMGLGFESATHWNEFHNSFLL
ncbi:hypothetical protein KFK09_019382 [Dendrobium nobile]|uniref:Uncharacterized protein n=1 Tax=Dendrobium nobile TaxID=94219 RepID=A0A8T3AR48_DENNO|nr:hypothetical protein KFK09_019382 [Dendrobium nobile]